MIALIICGVLLWTIAGVAYFVINIGNKTKQEPWYGKVLMLPVIPLAYVLGWWMRR
jgi:hypothetical protein